jgi:uncharacterized protein
VQELIIESGDERLAASYSPAGDVAVVALHGASEGTRDSDLLQHLHRLLPPIGVGVVTFDRRGEGRSSGVPSRGRFNVQALDAIAVATSIDVRKVGLWGYSQGAWIAPIAAGDSDTISFVVGIASTGVTPSRQMTYAAMEHLRRNGCNEQTVRRVFNLRRDFESVIHGGEVDREDLARRLANASNEEWWEWAFLPESPLDPSKRAQWIEEMAYDPLPSFRRVSVPLLLFYGEDDEWSPVVESVAAWRAAQGDRAEIVVIPDVGHDLCDSRGSVSGVYESQLVKWLRSLTL